VEAAHAEAVCAAVASTREATAVSESVKTLIKEAVSRATLVEREAQERVLKAEAESAASLAYVRGEADKSA
jgi:hypothetical protein